MSVPETPSQYRTLLEKLAAMEHEQWMEWAKNLYAKENLSSERIRQWYALMVPYSQLTENQKEQDRKWARKIIKEVLGPELIDFGKVLMQEVGKSISEMKVVRE